MWEQSGVRKALRVVDLFVTLGDRLPVGAEGRIVVWLFELPTHRIAENRRAGAGWYQRGSDLLTSLLWRRSLRRASRVVCGSQATADELGLGSAVVYPGLDDGFGPGRVGRAATSSISRRRTLATTRPAVLAAFAQVQTEVELLVGGGLGARTGAARALAGDRVRFLGRVSDDELVALYRGAAAYVDATLYEGFGYQILEAMACGAPVVASRLTSIPEVVGDAGLLADPRDPAAIAEALRRVLEEPGLAASLRERGFAQAGRFTWERTAADFGAVLDDVLA